MTTALETLSNLFSKSARKDEFKFLNISDVQWKPFAEKALNPTALVLPLALSEDPFAQLSALYGSVREITITKGTAQHVFEKVTSAEFATSTLMIKVEADAELELVFLQDQVTQSFSRVHIVLERNARVNATLIQSSTRKGQVRAHIECKGEGAEALVHGLTIGKETERQDLWVDVVHSVPHTRSDLIAWCVVQDQAHSVFNGKMTIDQTAPFTEAFQKNKNLILSPRASVDTFPKLFIANNEVKCAHGSTVSSLEPEQLNYLQSRGIDLPAAERMVLDGFIRQALEWIKNSDTRTEVETKLLGGTEEGWESA